MRFYWKILFASYFLAAPALAEPLLGSRTLQLQSLTLSETQYWAYTYEGNQLSFNAPWDEQEGDAILRDPKDLPALVGLCSSLSYAALKEVLDSGPISAKLQQLRERGATQELVLLVNILPAEASRKDLRRLDRDAYFFHWNGLLQKPHLALSDFKRGQWVWEVIAGPDACIQPDTNEIVRYLDYVLQRLGSN